MKRTDGMNRERSVDARMNHTSHLNHVLCLNHVSYLNLFNMNLKHLRLLFSDTFESKCITKHT